MARGTGVQRESRPPRGAGVGDTVICTPATHSLPCSFAICRPTLLRPHELDHAKGLPPRAQPAAASPAVRAGQPVAPPGDPALGAPGSRWLKRAGGSHEPPLRTANDRRPPGPTLPTRGGGARGGLNWLLPLEFRGSQEEEEGPSVPPPGWVPRKAPSPLTASVSHLHGGRDGFLPSWG